MGQNQKTSGQVLGAVSGVTSGQLPLPCSLDASCSSLGPQMALRTINSGDQQWTLVHVLHDSDVMSCMDKVAQVRTEVLV